LITKEQALYNYIEENLKQVKDRIAAAAMQAGREPDEITLVAVSKTFPAEAISAAVEYGVTDIGESRIQDAEPKISALGNIAKWHMIGHIQTNKVKKAIKMFDLLQSVDSMKLAEEINRRAGQMDKVVECLVEINSSGEESKYGISPDDTFEFLERLKGLPNVIPVGLMTIGPFIDDQQIIRHAFRMTKELFFEIKKMVGDEFSILSMGMSDDFEIAIEEGSNMVRVGTAIFGPRTK
jgi:pyridoxal phosphate enzyme (YggS family)